MQNTLRTAVLPTAVTHAAGDSMNVAIPPISVSIPAWIISSTSGLEKEGFALFSISVWFLSL